MIRIAVYRPDGHSGPGRLGEAELDATVTGHAELACAEVTVRDERGGELLCGNDFVFDPAAGGGPLATARADRQARAFGLGNAAFWAQLLLRRAAHVLQRPLPRLSLRIGLHDSPSRRWGGGHYRLPGAASPAESSPLAAAGEVHLGGGQRYLPTTGRGAAYFHAPAHNTAIVLHEVGHHICRHTADFRVNRWRHADDQHNGKVALDEGTADFLAAFMLGTPDLYRWHRAHLPASDPRRRLLQRRWTMAYLRPGSGGLAHANGTIWASALWTAYLRVPSGDAERFLRMVLLGLAGLGARSARQPDERFRRTQFSELLRAVVAADCGLAPVVLAAMADHGIGLDASNVELRQRFRALRPAASGR
ncbi:hypothetical protein [Amycolatopsis samaneae]|uniref:Uncharacterized protein n=1 Tax=Amycolatopsis samaneae TaxID=664691 RepID=A0ABW5GL63_9PSEU